MTKPALSYRAGAWWGGRSTGLKIGTACAAVLAVAAAVGVTNNDGPTAPPTASAPEPSTAPAETPQQARARILREQCTTGLSTSIETTKSHIAAGNLMAANAMLSMCDEFPQSAEFKAFAAKSRAAIAEQQKKQAAATVARKKSEGVRIGMTQDDVLASSWGKPRKINTTTTARGTREQWVYDGGYLYFEDGVLTTVQN